jgi:hypothetical protein
MTSQDHDREKNKALRAERKQARLGDQLRANLLKRKEQARRRAGEAKPKQRADGRRAGSS